MRRHPAFTDDSGFTLLELLVVCIVIGILAAISLPSFLHQREKSYDAAAKSVLRDLGTTEEAVLTDTGVYSAVATLPDFNPSPDVVVTLISGAGSPTGFCASAYHTAGGGTWFYDTLQGGLLKAGQTCS